MSIKLINVSMVEPLRLIEAGEFLHNKVKKHRLLNNYLNNIYDKYLHERKSMHMGRKRRSLYKIS